MSAQRFMPALYAAILVAVGAAAPAMAEARDFKDRGHKATHQVRDQGHYRSHHQHDHRPRKRGSGYRQAAKRHYHRQRSYSRPYFSYSGRYRRHGDGIVNFSFRYRH